MIEIGKTQNERLNRDYKLGKKKKNKSGTSVNTLESEFLGQLNLEPADENLQEEISFNDLLSELDEQGRKFRNKRTLTEMAHYKALVKNFLKKTVRESYAIAEQKGGWKKTSRRLYKKIDVINDRLEELAKVIMQNQSENINLMSRLDEIRGLLLDMYH